MGFLSICTALYDYQPQADGELEIKEGELLYILEKDSGDDWWKAKKRAAAEDDDEPVGLIPNNYVEQVSVEGRMRSSFHTSGIPASATIFFSSADFTVDLNCNGFRQTSGLTKSLYCRQSQSRERKHSTTILARQKKR